MSARRQRGWAGLVMLLIALIVGGLVVRSVLKQMGLADASAAARNEVSAPPTPSGAAAPASPIERARGVQDQVLRQGARVDEQQKSLDR